MEICDLKMEGETVLTDEQLARLKRLWLSGLDGCPRSTYHRVMDTPKTHKHFLSQRGSVGHQIAEAMLMGEILHETELDFGDFTGDDDVCDDIVESLDLPMANMAEWMKETEMDLGGSECEVHVEKELDLGYTLSGRIDVLTPTHILDFKTGKRRVQKATRLQLMGALDITRGLDGEDRECKVVYLGSPKPAEVDIFKPTKKMDWDDYVQEYEDAIASQIAYREMIRVGKQVPTKFGILCGMCGYRHVCSGI